MISTLGLLSRMVGGVYFWRQDRDFWRQVGQFGLIGFKFRHVFVLTVMYSVSSKFFPSQDKGRPNAARMQEHHYKLSILHITYNW